jgi:hypothetical protein
MFVPPRGTLTVHATEKLLTLSALLGVSLLVSAQSSRLRSAVQVARQREQRAGALQLLASEMSDIEDAAELVRAAQRSVRDAAGSPVTSRCAGRIREVAAQASRNATHIVPGRRRELNTYPPSAESLTGSASGPARGKSLSMERSALFSRDRRFRYRLGRRWGGRGGSVLRSPEPEHRRRYEGGPHGAALHRLREEPRLRRTRGRQPLRVRRDGPGGAAPRGLPGGALQRQAHRGRSPGVRKGHPRVGRACCPA